MQPLQLLRVRGLAGDLGFAGGHLGFAGDLGHMHGGCAGGRVVPLDLRQMLLCVLVRRSVATDDANLDVCGVDADGGGGSGECVDRIRPD
eukprot:scaffold102406_cov63-Phaeocystis_antarctica.AAC.3